MRGLLVCSDHNGLLLFARGYGGFIPPSSSPSFNLLSAVHIFTANHGRRVHGVLSDGVAIVYAQYRDVLTLVLVKPSDGIEGEVQLCEDFLLSLFDACVFASGELRSSKKQFRACYQFLDGLMEQPTIATSLVELAIVPPPLHAALADRLQAFAQAIQTNFVSIYVQKERDVRLCLSSDTWLTLKPIELRLIAKYLGTLVPADMRDIPVFLPYTSPKTPFRLVTVQLLTGVYIVLLCGPDPSVVTIAEAAQKEFSTHKTIRALEAIADILPRGSPDPLSLDPSVVGFLLNKSPTMIIPYFATANEAEATNVQAELLRFRLSANNISHSLSTPADPTEDRIPGVQCFYTKSKNAILCAITRAPYEFYCMLKPNTPVFAVQPLCEEVLAASLRSFGLEPPLP